MIIRCHRVKRHIPHPADQPGSQRKEPREVPSVSVLNRIEGMNIGDK